MTGAGHRERPADFVRAVAIGMVVLGHWLVIAVTEAGGDLDGVNVLGSLTWTHPFTWLFQVMPLFFLVGGYANATSMQRHRRAGGDSLGWVMHRYRRLLAPSTLLLVAVAVAVAGARALGAPPSTVGTGAWVATVPLWFLAAYLAVIALAPLTHAAHRRWGLVVPSAAVAVIAITDVARIGLDEPGVAQINYLVVWAAVHQLGYAWHDGRLPTRPRTGVGLAAAGSFVLVGCTVLGPYPVSMVTVPGAELQNTEPPTLALLALAVIQTGLVLAVRDRADHWLRRGRRWRPVSGAQSCCCGRSAPCALSVAGAPFAQSVLLTVFLWHMAAAVVAAVVLHGTGIMAVAPLGSPTWLVLRIPWVATCALVLAVFVAMFGRLERSTRHDRPGRRAGSGFAAWSAVFGIIGVLAGILVIALAGAGMHGPLALPTEALAVYATGAALVALSLISSRRH